MGSTALLTYLGDTSIVRRHGRSRSSREEIQGSRGPPSRPCAPSCGHEPLPCSRSPGKGTGSSRRTAEDPTIRPNGSFQWTVRFRDPQTVGPLRADVSVRSNNTFESSLAFTITAPHSGNRYTLLIDGRPMSAVTNSEVAPLGKSPALFVVNARMAVRCFTMTSLAL
jgi:hypothetical protein